MSVVISLEQLQNNVFVCVEGAVCVRQEQYAFFVKENLFGCC